MQMSETIKDTVDTKKLRDYGLTMAFVLVAVFGLTIPLLRGKPIAVWPFVAAIIFAGAALIKPGMLNGVYALWMKFGNTAGAINSRIILGVLFFVLILPYGLCSRLLGRDTLRKSFLPDARSYRELRTTKYEPKTMENPY